MGQTVRGELEGGTVKDRRMERNKRKCPDKGNFTICNVKSIKQI